MSGEHCGQPNILKKLTSISTQDQSSYHESFHLPQSQSEDVDKANESKVEYFEFRQEPQPTGANQNEAFWVAEFNATNQLPAQPHINPHVASTIPFEQGFSKPWISEFTQSNKSGIKNEAIDNASWITEFMETQLVIDEPKHELDDESQKEHGNPETDWIKEFQYSQSHPQIDDIEMKNIAFEILSNLHTQNDPKLANSRFIAYLRNLIDQPELSTNPQPDPSVNIQADAETFAHWKTTFLKNISPIVEKDQQEHQWQLMEKAWDNYETSGFGYKNFIQKEFSIYQFSLPVSENPYSSHSIDDLLKILHGPESKNPQLKERILAMEMLVSHQPHNQLAWKQLGFLQQANEVDIQAISALLKATSLNPKDVASWIALAASCVNESCIPDAYQAITNCFNQISLKADEIITMEFIEKEGLFSSSSLSLRHQSIIAAILYNISGNQEKAAHVLKSIPLSGNVFNDWTLLNRLGATFANSKRYSDAINIYDHLLAQGIDYPRIYYNKGIALMCSNDYEGAIRCFILAIEKQLSVKAISNLPQQFLSNFKSPWEALNLTLSLLGKDQLIDADFGNLDILSQIKNSFALP